MQIAAAAIVCDYDHVYAFVNPDPCWDLWEVSKFSLNPFYREDLEKRAEEQKIDLIWDTWENVMPINRYGDLMKTREFTVLDPYEGRIRDRVEKYDAPNSCEKILNTGDVQNKVWEGVGRVVSAGLTSSE